MGRDLGAQKRTAHGPRAPTEHEGARRRCIQYVVVRSYNHVASIASSLASVRAVRP